MVETVLFVEDVRSLIKDLDVCLTFAGLGRR